MRLARADDKKGSLSLLNNSRVDIFNWQLVCNRELVLTDRYGAKFRPTQIASVFVHEFVRPSHGLGTFLIGQNLDFTFEALEAVDSNLSCMLNGRSVLILENELPLGML